MSRILYVGWDRSAATTGRLMCIVANRWLDIADVVDVQCIDLL